MSTYDPFSYGQIKLGGDAKRAAETPDDILFQDAGPGPSTAMKAANSDWELLDDTKASPPSMRTDSLQAAMDFGADVLGETAPSSSPRQQAQRPARNQGLAPAPAAPPAVAPGRAQGTTPMPASPPAARQTPVQASTKPRSRPATQPSMRPAATPNRMLAALLPSVTIACGGSAAAWLYAMEHNPIMASIVGVTSLIAAAFLRVLFRG